MGGAAADETMIEIEIKFTKIIWIVFGERVKKAFLSTPDWVIPFIQNLPPIIFNKTPPIRCENHSDVIQIIIPAWSLTVSNCRFLW